MGTKDCAAQQRLVDFELEINQAPQLSAQSARNLVSLIVVDRASRNQSCRDGVLLFCLEPIEARRNLLVFQQLRVQQLHRHVATEAHVAATKDHTHPADAEQRVDAVAVIDPAPDEGGARVCRIVFHEKGLRFAAHLSVQ